MSKQARETRLTKRSIPILAIVCVMAAAAPFAGRSIGSAFLAATLGSSPAGSSPVAWRDLAGNQIVRASDRGTTWVRFDDGVEIEPATSAKPAGRPFGLARADFDNDGMQDLAVSSQDGSSGTVRIFRGNLGSVYPNAPEARDAVAAGTPVGAPFVLPGLDVSSPVTPEFMIAGDFDGDGNADLAVAKSGDDVLYVLPGIGNGTFGEARSVAVTGTVTTVASGDVNRPDGRPELIVGVTNGRSSQILVVSGVTAVDGAAPVGIDVPGRVNDIAVGDVTGMRFADIVASTTAGVVLVPGRDSSRETPRLESELVVSRPDVRSIALGDFSGGRRLDVALLGDNGRIDLLVGPDPVEGTAKSSEKPSSVEGFAETGAGSERIVAANVSSRTGMDLVALDRAGNSLAVLEGGYAAKGGDAALAAYDVAGTPVAAIPMRLNPDAIDDLVIVTAESAVPVVMNSAKLRAAFTVVNTNDSGAGSLRDAITQANMLAGADTIDFNIPGVGPHTISTLSALPVISETLDIDGATEPDFAGTPVVVINGSGAGTVHGIDTLSTSGVKIRGLVIRNFGGGAGILVNASTSAVIEGCYIGTTVTGTVAAANLGGISVSNAGMTTIGGTTASARNVISGNSNNGIAIFFSGNDLIQGNYIGVTAAGNAPLGNGFNGVEINDSTLTFVGNGVAGATNVISANTAGGGLSNGVYVHGGMSGMNAVQGNIIGLASNGTTVLGNGANGVLDDASTTLVGGPTSQTRNIISGNLESGIRVESQAFNATIWGNYIGLDVNGTLDRGNGNDGVWLAGGGLGTVGGFMPSDGNVISGNQFSGVQVSGGFSQLVAGNKIGVDASAVAAVPNSLDGVRASGGSGIGVILNKIAGNSGNGIGAVGGFEYDFSENDITQNGGLGIDLGNDGVTTNDPLDGDSGPGDLQNFPIISSAVTDMGVTTVSGTLNSESLQDYRLNFYISSVCDGSGFGEGRTFAGGIDISTDMLGDAPFMVNLDIPAASGELITATASLLGTPARSGKVSAPLGPPMIPLTTSEFSPCFAATSLDADVSVSITDAPDPIPAGGDITYMLTVNNAGPLTANNAVASIATPPNTTFQSATGAAGWSVSQAPPMGGTGLVTFSNAMFGTGTPQVLTVVVRVDNFTSGGTMITGMADISSDLNDPMPANNSASTTTTVLTVADISVDKTANVSSAMPGEDITYTVTVFASGSEDAQNPVLTDVVPTNTTFQSIVAPMGWTVMTPPVNGTGTITISRAQLDIKTTHIFTIVVRVNAGVSGGTTITNTATLTSSTSDPDNSNNSDFVDVSVVAPPAQADLSVTRVASPDPAVRGDNLTFTITISNNGPDAASSLSLFETIPADTTLVSVTVPAGWTEGGKGQGRGVGFPLEYVTSSMAPNTAAIFTVVVSVSLLTPDGTFLDGQSEIVSFGTPDPNPSNNIASTSTEVGPPPQTDLALDKTATPTTVTPGSAITYNLVATNIGSENATDLTINDATPAGTTFVSASPSSGGNLTVPSANGTGSILCVWPGVTAPGESRTLSVIVNVSATAEDGSTIVNSASTASLAFESDFSNNNDSVSVAVSANENLPRADVEISTSTIPETVDTGEQLVYTITVRNNGPDTAEDVLLRTSSPLGTRFVSLTTTQGTVTAPPAGGVGIAEVAIGDIEADNAVTVVLTVNVIGEGGDTVSVDVVIESSTNDPVAGNNSIAGSTGVLAGNDVLLTWDPPLPTVGDERNPPLHLQSQTVTAKSIAAALAAKVAGPRNTLVGYNIYRSNTPNTTPVPANFFTSVPANQTTVVAPTAPGGSFFVVTAQYPNGESGETNAASGGIPEPDIASFQIKGGKVIINGTGFTDSVTVFIDGIPFNKAAKVKKENTRVQQKGKLLTGQSVTDYLNQQGGVVLVSVLNSDTGIGTFLYRR